jgi:Leucine-rich repeat (LRR) protein
MFFFNKESFKCLPNLKCLFLACNNIKSIRLKHDEFNTLESLDLSFNNLTPSDVVHLGVLNSLKFLKLTGNNLNFLPDTFSKLYVYTKE